MQFTTAKNILISLLLFLGINALRGALIISPSGKLSGRMPVSILEHAPFTNFMLPGMILFLALGVLPILNIWALNTWIQIEVIFLRGVHRLRTFDMFFALLMRIVTLQPEMRHFYKNQNNKI